MKNPLTQTDVEELERCKDPLYFYNKYVKFEGKRQLTQEEFDARIFACNKQHLKVRNVDARYLQYPLSLKQVFKP